MRVLEVGAGRGTITDCIVDCDTVLALEVDPDFVAILRERFAGRANVEVLAGSATDPAVTRRAAGRVDSAMSFNVLEHIADDISVLRNVLEVLPPGGRFVCFVPAFPSIYGSMDSAVGHVRRYTRAEMRSKMTEAGFHVVAARYMNFLGYFAWLVAGRVVRFEGVAGAGSRVGLYDRLVIPVSRVLERRWRPPFGQSLLVVGERPRAG